MVFGAMLVGGMVAGGLIAGGVVGHYATKDRYKSMAIKQEQQEQLQQAQAQAEQAERAAQAAELQAVQVQGQRSDENKSDAFLKLEKLGSLRQQGLITDEEFQKLKSRLISTI
ncbi:MAG: SHOCT domain-containing protein [Nitrososphaeraceae archaeon]